MNNYSLKSCSKNPNTYYKNPLEAVEFTSNTFDPVMADMSASDVDTFQFSGFSSRNSEMGPEIVIGRTQSLPRAFFTVAMTLQILPRI